MQCSHQTNGGATNNFCSFDNAAMWIVPTPQKQKPMLKKHGNQFSIELAQNAPWFFGLPLIDLPVRFPQFEKQFNLPPQANEDQRFCHTHTLDGDIGDEKNPVC